MPAPEAPTALAGGVGLLRRAFAYTASSLSLVTPESLSAPTPCGEWDLGELLTHMNDSLLALHEAIAVGRVNLTPVEEPGAPFAGFNPGAPHTTQLVSGLCDRACRMLHAWSDAESGEAMAVGDAPVSSGIVAAAGSIEVAVHGWDVSAAHGRPTPIPTQLAEELLDLAPLFVTDADRPSRFAAPVPAPPGSAAGDRLVAFLGRRPR